MITPYKQSLLAVLVLLFAGSTAQAEGFVGGGVSAPANGSAANFRKAARMAILLGQLADKNKDAVLMLAALKIKNEIGMQVLNLHKELSGVPVNSVASGVTVDAAPSEEVKAPFDPKTEGDTGMGSRAKKYASAAEKLDGIANLIDAVSFLASRGGLKGPSEHEDVVRPNQTDSYKMTFKAGEPAIIEVIGDGDSNLVLSVHDDKNKLVCKSAVRGDEQTCEIVPRKQGQYTIRVANLGSKSNRYHVLTN